MASGLVALAAAITPSSAIAAPGLSRTVEVGNWLVWIKFDVIRKKSVAASLSTKPSEDGGSIRLDCFPAKGIAFGGAMSFAASKFYSGASGRTAVVLRFDDFPPLRFSGNYIGGGLFSTMDGEIQDSVFKEIKSARWLAVQVGNDQALVDLNGAAIAMKKFYEICRTMSP